LLACITVPLTQQKPRLAWQAPSPFCRSRLNVPRTFSQSRFVDALYSPELQQKPAVSPHLLSASRFEVEKIPLCLSQLSEVAEYTWPSLQQ
jgi:hypothetical protein